MKIIVIRDNQELITQAAEWFHQKWEVPFEAYIESMNQTVRDPLGSEQWYLIFSEDHQIIGGCGVIDNDFHNRKDLTPNLCALYIESEFRNKGLGKGLLDYVCMDLRQMGLKSLYLITDHTDLYEKLGWEFFTTVEEDGGSTARMYHMNLGD